MAVLVERTEPVGDEAVRRADLEILWSLRSIIQSLDVYSRRLSSTLNITLPQLLCLFVVVSEKQVTAKEIAAKIHVSASTLVGVLDRLEVKGLVERSRDPSDRRRVSIKPTPQGIRFISSAPSPFGEDFSIAFGRLAPERQRVLADLATELAEMMQVPQASGA